MKDFRKQFILRDIATCEKSKGLSPEERQFLKEIKKLDKLTNDEFNTLQDIAEKSIRRSF